MRVRAFAFALLAAWSLLLVGCASKPPPDLVINTAATGLWVGGATDLDIQDGGYFKMTRNGQEIMGSWTPVDENNMKVKIGEQEYDVPFTRKDLQLTITLPGDTSPSTFTQM